MEALLLGTSIGLELATEPSDDEGPRVAGRGYVQGGRAGALHPLIHGGVQDIKPGVATSCEDDHLPGLAPRVAGPGLLDVGSGQRLAGGGAQLEPRVSPQGAHGTRRVGEPVSETEGAGGGPRGLGGLEVDSKLAAPARAAAAVAPRR